MTQQRGRAAADLGPTWPEVPGLGRLPNKQFFTARKGLKKASVNTLALLAV